MFDLALQVVKFGIAGDNRPVDPTGWSILHVYGSPNPNETALSSNGTVMRVGGVGGVGGRTGCDLIGGRWCSEHWTAQRTPTPLPPAPTHTHHNPAQVHTLFPSPKTEQGIKGGVVLLRLRPPANGANTPLRLAVTYADREGKQFR